MFISVYVKCPKRIRRIVATIFTKKREANGVQLLDSFISEA
jgi:hypothetical protein